MVKLAEEMMESHNLNFYDAVMEASNKILDEVVKSIAIPRRHTATMREIWQLQLRLPRRNGKRAFRLMELNKFRAGFDFLEMRGEVEDGEVKQLADWWQTFQTAGRTMRQAMVADLDSVAKPSGTRRRRPSTRKKKSKPAS